MNCHQQASTSKPAACIKPELKVMPLVKARAVLEHKKYLNKKAFITMRNGKLMKLFQRKYNYVLPKNMSKEYRENVLKLMILNDKLNSGEMTIAEVTDSLDNEIKQECESKMKKFEYDVSAIYTNNIIQYGNNVSKYFQLKIRILKEEMRRVCHEVIELTKNAKKFRAFHCEICKIYFKMLYQFSVHFSTRHQCTNFNIKSQRFNTLADFYNWKITKDHEHLMNLVKVVEVKSSDPSSNERRMYFLCENPCNSHMVEIISQDMVKQVKNWCRAFIEAIIDESGQVNVIYSFHHISHSRFLKNFNTLRIKTLMQLGLSDENIFHCLSFVNPWNQLFSTDQNDLMSVVQIEKNFKYLEKTEYLISSLLYRMISKSESREVRLFNPPIDSKGLKLCIVVISENHLSALKDFSERGIFVENVPTDIGLDLVSIRVLDNTWKCIPAGYILSNTCNVNILFSQIKSLYEEFHPKYFLSNLYNGHIWKAYLSVFPKNDTLKIPRQNTITIRKNKYPEVHINKVGLYGNLFDKLDNLLKGRLHLKYDQTDDFVKYCSQYYRFGTTCTNMSFADAIEMVFNRDDTIRTVVPEDVEISRTNAVSSTTFDELSDIKEINVDRKDDLCELMPLSTIVPETSTTYEYENGVNDINVDNVDVKDDICELMSVETIEEEQMEKDESKGGTVEWQELITQLSSLNFVPSNASSQMLTKMTNIWEEFKFQESIS